MQYDFTHIKHTSLNCDAHYKIMSVIDTLFAVCSM